MFKPFVDSIALLLTKPHEDYDYDRNLKKILELHKYAEELAARDKEKERKNAEEAAQMAATKDKLKKFVADQSQEAPHTYPFSDGASLTSSKANEILAQSGLTALLNITDMHTDTVLHKLIAGSNEKKLEKFKSELAILDKDNTYDFKQPGVGGKTVLHIAVEKSEHAIIEILLKKDPKLLFTTDIKGNHSGHLAAKQGDDGYATMKILYTGLKTRADIETFTNARNNKGENTIYLSVASQKGKKRGYNTTQFLLNQKLNLKSKTNLGETVGHVAVRCSKEDVLNLLFDPAITPGVAEMINIPNNLGTTPLHVAAAEGKATLIKPLCKSGANVEAIDGDGNTPLQCCIINWTKHLGSDVSLKFEDTAKILLQHKARLDTQGNNGFTVFHYLMEAIAEALFNFKYEETKILPMITTLVLDNEQASLKVSNCDGNRPLQLAIAFGLPAKIQKQKGTVFNNKIFLLKSLLLENATDSVKYANLEGNAALHYAVLVNTPQACDNVQFLINNGADINQENNNGYRALDIVNFLSRTTQNSKERQQLAKLQNLLKTYGAEPNPNLHLDTENFQIPKLTHNYIPNWYIGLDEDRAKTPTKNGFPESVAGSEDATNTTSAYDWMSDLGRMSEIANSDYVSAGLTSENSRAPSEISEIPEGDIYYQDNEAESRVDLDLIQYSEELREDKETTPTDQDTPDLPDPEYPGYRLKF